jgi:hypothetical protein
MARHAPTLWASSSVRPPAMLHVTIQWYPCISYKYQQISFISGLVVPLPPMIYWSKFEQDPLLLAQNKRVPHNCNTVGLIKEDASAPCEQPAAVLMPRCFAPENHDNQ